VAFATLALAPVLALAASEGEGASARSRPRGRQVLLDAGHLRRGGAFIWKIVMGPIARARRARRQGDERQRAQRPPPTRSARTGSSQWPGARRVGALPGKGARSGCGARAGSSTGGRQGLALLDAARTTIRAERDKGAWPRSDGWSTWRSAARARCRRNAGSEDDRRLVGDLVRQSIHARPRAIGRGAAR
jgi:hypothetical protein